MAADAARRRAPLRAGTRVSAAARDGAGPVYGGADRGGDRRARCGTGREITPVDGATPVRFVRARRERESMRYDARNSAKYSSAVMRRLTMPARCACSANV